MPWRERLRCYDGFVSYYRAIESYPIVLLTRNKKAGCSCVKVVNRS